MKVVRLFIFSVAFALTLNFKDAIARPSNTQTVQPTSEADLSCLPSSFDRRKATEFVQQGVNRREQRDYRGALTAFDEALKICPTFALAYHQKGFTFAQQQSWDEAIAAYRNALDHYQESDQLSLAKIHENLGDALRRGASEIPADAQQEYEQAINLYEDSGTTEDYEGLGNLLRRLERSDEALEAYKSAIRLDSNNADAYFNLGSILVEKSRQDSDKTSIQKLEESFESFTQAIELWQIKHRNFPDDSRFSRNLATAYESRGNVRSLLNQPEELVKADYDIANEIRIGEAECSTSFSCIELGRSLKRQGSLEAAVETYTKAIEQIENSSDVDSVLLATAYNNRGAAQLELSNQDNQVAVESAVSDFETAIRVLREAELSPTIVHYINLRRGLSLQAFYERQDSTRRRELLERADQIYFQMKDWLEEITEKTIDSLPGRVESPDLFNLLFPQDAYINYRDLAVSLASTQDYYAFYIDLLMGIHQRKQFKGFDIDALDVVERARARSLLELLTDADVYRWIGDHDLAERERALRQKFQLLMRETVGFNYDQLNPNASLLEQPAPRNEDVNSQEAADSKDSLCLSDNDITTVENQIQQCLQEYRELWDEIGLKNPEYAQVVDPPNLDLQNQDARKQLLGNDDTVLLEYWLGETKSYLWAVSIDEIKSYELPGRTVLESAASDFQRHLTIPGERAKPVATARRGKLLSQMLLGCAAHQLSGKKQILVVADGILQYIPFNALPVPEPTQNCNLLNIDNIHVEPNNLPDPLLLQYEIINLPSASALTQIRQRNRNVQERGLDPDSARIAVFADPIFNRNDPRLTSISQDQEPNNEHSSGQPYPRLSGTLREAEKIQEIAEGEDLKYLPLSGLDASRDSVFRQLSGFDIIHFATHGFLNDRHPEESGLVLSQFDEEGNLQKQNSFLSMRDVFQLEPSLDASLVVLSGCRTGLGIEVAGEGLLGLMQGFMYAGVDSVIVSLWAVDDEATEKLMAEFYRQLLDKEVTPAKALTRAQRYLQESDSYLQNPYYWAAFSLYGEWQ